VIRAAAVLASLALLAGCGESDTDPGPGGVTVGEARALDQAAEMLDQQRLPDEALDEPEANSATDSGESEPAATVTGTP
jgi:hypothetical protein